jgi:hypothetical protein
MKEWTTSGHIVIEQRKERQLLAEKCDEDLRKIRKNYASTMQVHLHLSMV